METTLKHPAAAIEERPQPHVTDLDRESLSPVIREILEETAEREKLGLLRLENAAEQAQRRVDALQILHRAAIRATQPIHWLLMKNKQGQVFARFNHAGAERIGTIYGITVIPDGDVQIKEEAGKRRTAELTGSVTSETLGVTISSVRAYRVEGEDFLGRPADDYTAGTKVVAGVGNNDWIQSTQTALRTKAIRLVSGIITVSPAELAAVWEITEEDVLQQCTMGPGFSREERSAAGASGGSAVNEKQVKRMFGIASGRIKDKGYKAKSAEIVQQCIEHVVRKVKGSSASTKPEDVTLDCYEAVCKLIETWEPGKIPAPQTAPTAAASSSTDPGTESFATPGQIAMLQGKANDRAKALPDAATDGAAILYEAIYEVFGDNRPADKIPQSQLADVVKAITAWGAAETSQGNLV